MRRTLKQPGGSRLLRNKYQDPMTCSASHLLISTGDKDASAPGFQHKRHLTKLTGHSHDIQAVSEVASTRSIRHAIGVRTRSQRSWVNRQTPNVYHGSPSHLVASHLIELTTDSRRPSFPPPVAHDIARNHALLLYSWDSANIDAACIMGQASHSKPRQRRWG